jgi:hypothetical protein
MGDLGGLGHWLLSPIGAHGYTVVEQGRVVSGGTKGMGAEWPQLLLPPPLEVQGWRPDSLVVVEDAHHGYDGWFHGRCKRHDGR